MEAEAFLEASTTGGIMALGQLGLGGGFGGGEKWTERQRRRLATNFICINLQLYSRPFRPRFAAYFQSETLSLLRHYVLDSLTIVTRVISVASTTPDRGIAGWESFHLLLNVQPSLVHFQQEKKTTLDYHHHSHPTVPLHFGIARKHSRKLQAP